MKKIILIVNLLFCCITQAQTNYVINYNGSGNSINIGTSAGNGVRSIEFWFKPTVTINSTTPMAGYTFVERNDGSQLYEYGIYVRGSDWNGFGNEGHIAFFVRYSGTLHEIYSNANSWTAGTWYHVAGVIDPSTGMKLYINGVLQTNTDAGATLAVQTDNSNSTYLGVWGNSGLRYFNGEMDELRFWNRAISQTEIQTKKCLNLVPSNETGLQAYWEFNEGSGTQIIDATANAYNGNINGATWLIDTYCAVGIESLSIKEIELLIYPNPSNGIFNIETGNMDKQLLQVFDLTGKIVLSQLINNTSTIDLTNLPEGIYNVKISNSSTVANKRIVIVK